MASLVSPLLRDPKLDYEPSPRYGHYSAAIGGKLYAWGGRTQDFSDIGKAQLLSAIEIFDPSLEVWKEEATSGATPPGLYNGVCAAINESMYVCCGNDGNDLHNTLHQFDTTKLQWKQIRVRNPSQGPMRKTGCGMVAYQGDKLVLFAGYGFPSGPIQRGANYTPSNRTNAIGYSNEFHIFHLKEGNWSSPSTTGERPPPCSAFSFTAIDDHRVVLFGGYQNGRVKGNDIYILDLQAMHWRKLSNPGGGPWPGVRSAHSACCLNFGEEHPQLLVTGGRNVDNDMLNDAWLLDVDSATWQELQLPNDTPHRWGHTTTAFSPTSGLEVEAIMFGGSSNFKGINQDDDFIKVAETVVLQFVQVEVGDRREWLLVGVANKRQLGTPERVREKIDKLEQRSSATEEDAEKKATKEEIRAAQERVQEANRRAQEAERKMEAIKKELEESQLKEKQLIKEKEEAKRQAEAIRKELEESQTRKRQLMEEMEKVKREAEAFKKESQARKRQLKVGQEKARTEAEACRKELKEAQARERQLKVEQENARREAEAFKVRLEESLTKERELKAEKEEAKKKAEAFEKELEQKDEDMKVQRKQFQKEKDQLMDQIQHQLSEKEGRFKEELQKKVKALNQGFTTQMQQIKQKIKGLHLTQKQLEESQTRERQLREKKDEDMKVQQMKFQVEKDQLTAQIHFLQHQLSENEGQFKDEIEELLRKVKAMVQRFTTQMQQIKEKIKVLSQLHLARVTTRDVATITVDDTRPCEGDHDLQTETELTSLEHNLYLQIEKQEEYIQQQREHIQQQKEHLDEVWNQVEQLQELLSMREAEMYHLQSQSQMANWNTSLGCYL